MSFPFIKQLLNCTNCPLSQGRTQVVVDDGNINSKILFIAEAPGEKEDITGKPLVGRSGKMFNEYLEKILGLKREDVFVTNCCQCRPPKNRDPKEDELEKCSYWVRQQIMHIKPQIIVTLGRFAMYEILKDKELKISEVHGQLFETNYLGLKVKVMPLYHPSACIYRKELRKEFEEDMKKIKEYL